MRDNFICHKKDLTCINIIEDSSDEKSRFDIINIISFKNVPMIKKKTTIFICYKEDLAFINHIEDSPYIRVIWRN